MSRVLWALSPRLLAVQKQWGTAVNRPFSTKGMFTSFNQLSPFRVSLSNCSFCYFQSLIKYTSWVGQLRIWMSIKGIDVFFVCFWDRVSLIQSVYPGKSTAVKFNHMNSTWMWLCHSYVDGVCSSCPLLKNNLSPPIDPRFLKWNNILHEFILIHS